ncbi:MAG: sulfotransferase family 2 domain-containing protein [Bacteroidota bacterium]
MLISHSKKFIFIHVYKVAGTSIRKALHKYAHRGWKFDAGNLNETARDFKKFYLETPVKDHVKFAVGEYPKVYGREFEGHSTAREVKASLPPEVYDTYFKFAFVRNPWDWQVSLYHYMLKKKTHFQHEFISQMRDFDEYLDWRLTHEVKLQRDVIYDETGNLLVDFVGKQDQMEEDFVEICRRLNIKETLPHVNRSNRGDYRKYYTKRSASLVAEAFQADIETFGFEF